MVDLSLIIVSYKSFDEIKANIQSILSIFKSYTYEIIIVNNYPGDLKLKELSDDKAKVCIVEAGSNLGFAKANNLGLKRAKGKYILFVNPDVIMLSDVDRLIKIIEDDTSIGIVGPLTRIADLSILPSCGEFPSLKNWISSNFFFNRIFPKVKFWGNYSMEYFDYKGTKEVDWISGAYMLGRKEVLDRIGGFDESFFMYNEDVDICWSLRKAGYKVVFSDSAEIIHTVGHAAQKKSTGKAKMMVDSFSVLWRKYYSHEYVKKMFFVLYAGSKIRKMLWTVLFYTHIRKDKNMINYYSTVISETEKQLKSNMELLKENRFISQ